MRSEEFEKRMIGFTWNEEQQCYSYKSSYGSLDAYIKKHGHIVLEGIHKHDGLVRWDVLSLVEVEEILYEFF